MQRTTPTSTACATDPEFPHEQSADISDLALRLAAGHPGRWCVHFGITVLRGQRVGRGRGRSRVIEDHDELGERAGGHEELYFVSNGRAGSRSTGTRSTRPRARSSSCAIRQRSARLSRRRQDDGRGRWRQARRGVHAVGLGATRPRSGLRQRTTTRRPRRSRHFLAESPGDAGVLYNLPAPRALTGTKESRL